MSKPGYNMGKVRWREFVTHVRRLESSIHVISKFGALKFSGVYTYSYVMLVGRIWPEHKIIVWNEDAQRTSKTTTAHLRAVTNAQIDLTDYTFLPASNEEMEENPFQLIATRWNEGKNFNREETTDILAMFTFLYRNKNREKLMKEYVALKTQEERDSMRCMLELAREV